VRNIWIHCVVQTTESLGGNEEYSKRRRQQPAVVGQKLVHVRRGLSRSKLPLLSDSISYLVLHMYLHHGRNRSIARCLDYSSLFCRPIRDWRL